MTRGEIIDALMKLSQAEVEVICVRLQAPRSLMSNNNTAMMALDLLRWCEARNELPQLEEALQAVLEARSQNTPGSSSHTTNHYHGPVHMTNTTDNSRHQSVSNSGDMQGVNLNQGDNATQTATYTHQVVPVSDSGAVDEEQYKADVKEVLHALTDAIEELEEKQYNLTSRMFGKFARLDVHEKTLADVQKMMEEAWTAQAGQDMKTDLQKLEGTKVFKALMDSKLLSAIVQAVLKAAV